MMFESEWSSVSDTFEWEDAFLDSHAGSWNQVDTPWDEVDPVPTAFASRDWRSRAIAAPTKFGDLRRRVSSIATIVAASWSRVFREREIRRIRAAWRTIDDRTLKDVGISRVEFEYRETRGHEADRTAMCRGAVGLCFRRSWGRRCLALLLVLTITTAAAPGSQPLGPKAASEQEPITAVPLPSPADPLKLALGEQLFADPRLSGNRSRACISCHDIHANGADANRHDKALDGSEIFFNTPTVFNAALSFRFGWEGRFRRLQAQVEAIIENPQIMGASIGEVLRRLSADPELVRRFEEAYGQGPEKASLSDAITTYEQSLLTPGSRFDRWLGGDAAALSVEELNGYQLFKSLGCISCHQGVNVGGNLFEQQGIFHPLATAPPKIVRVPSLRNVATTPPYFHDGSAPTLDEAVLRMGNTQLDQTLSDQQVRAIVAFLKTLTGNYHGAPVVAASP